MVEAWYTNLSPIEKMEFAALSVIMGNERVSSELAKCNSVTALFERVAHQVYGAN